MSLAGIYWPQKARVHAIHWKTLIPALSSLKVGGTARLVSARYRGWVYLA